MSHKKYLSVVFVLCCASFLYGCSLLDKSYDIKVKNMLDVNLAVKIDGVVEGVVPPGGEIVINDVEKGSHFLQGEADGYNTIERHIDLDKDFVWTVY